MSVTNVHDGCENRFMSVLKLHGVFMFASCGSASGETLSAAAKRGRDYGYTNYY